MSQSISSCEKREITLPPPGQLLGQYNASGQAVQEVVWLDDLPLALLSTQETIRDNTATGTATGTTYVGTWSTLTSPHGYWGSNYRSAAVDTSAQPASATWRLNVSGSHKLYARWPVQANASAQARYQIQHSAGSTTVRVDQRQDGTAWVYLGQYLLSPSSLITLSAQPDGVVAADAIKAVSTNEAARVFYVHSDHLNTPRTVVNTQGQLRWRWLTEPWGQQPPEDNPSNLGVFTTALRLPGQLYDVESTLHYNTYRDYFPDLGRYLQSDPIGLQGGINTYAYVSGNPVSKIDPLGLLEHFMMELNGQSMSSLECGCRENYPAFTGNPPYRNNPDATTQANIGPAPEGWYYIVDRPQGGLGGQVMSFVTGKDEWFALYRNDGTPGDDTVEKGVVRREIRLHPKGPRGTSLGCVTLNNQADYDRLRKRLLSTTTGVIPGTNIKYYGTILLYRPSMGW